MTGNAESILAAKVAKKVTRQLLPLLTLTWFIAYIDRFNVSFAALQMNEQLGFSSTVFGLGGGIFFLGYSLFEIPSNLALARIGARRWLGRIMVSWGVISIAMMFTRDATSFYVLRFLLGVAEAGCFPGIAYYLSGWLLPQYRAAALGTIGTAAMLSGVVGGPLAAGLLSMDGLLGFAGWQWLFLLEGIPAVLVGCWLWYALPERPSSVRWLTADERDWAEHWRLRETGASERGLAAVASDARYWLWGISFFFATAAGAALRLFQPVILQRTAGLSNIAAALLTAFPAVAGVVAIVWIGRRASRHHEYAWHAAIPLIFSGAALACVGLAHEPFTATVVAALATIGVGSQPVLFAAVSAAATGRTNAVGIAFVNSVASVGSFFGPYLVGYLIDTTGVGTACALSGAMMVTGGIIASLPSRLHSRRAVMPQAATAL